MRASISYSLTHGIQFDTPFMKLLFVPRTTLCYKKCSFVLWEPMKRHALINLIIFAQIHFLVATKTH